MDNFHPKHVDDGYNVWYMPVYCGMDYGIIWYFVWCGIAMMWYGEVIMVVMR